MQIGCGFQFVYKTVFRQRRRAYRLLECRHESDFQDHYHTHKEKHTANTLFASTRSTILSRQWLLPRAVLPDCYLIYADLIKKIIPLGTFFTYAVSLSLCLPRFLENRFYWRKGLLEPLLRICVHDTHCKSIHASQHKSNDLTHFRFVLMQIEWHWHVTGLWMAFHICVRSLSL